MNILNVLSHEALNVAHIRANKLLQKCNELLKNRGKYHQSVFEIEKSIRTCRISG